MDRIGIGYRRGEGAKQKTYIDANAMSIPALPQSTHGCARQRPFVVVRRAHVHLDVPPFGRLLQLDFSGLIRPARNKIQRFRCDGQDERRLGALGKGWGPARTGLIRRPVEAPDRFDDPAVFCPGNAHRPVATVLSSQRSTTHSFATGNSEKRAYDTATRHVNDGPSEREECKV